MTLTKPEYVAYITAHIHFLYFIARDKKIFKGKTFEKFRNTKIEEKIKCHDAFIEDETVLDAYFATGEVSEIDQEILMGYKRKITSRFVIFKCLKKHAIFIDTDTSNVYAVKALGDPFDAFFPIFPVLVETTILPYNGQIIYDGFSKHIPVQFGSGMCRSFQSVYKAAKEAGEIITTL